MNGSEWDFTNNEWEILNHNWVDRYIDNTKKVLSKYKTKKTKLLLDKLLLYKEET